MLKIKPGQEIPTNPHCRKKLWFICDCGNEKQISYKNFTTKHIQSCGKCKQKTIYNWEAINKSKFGYLSISPNQPKIEFCSNTLLLWKCDCGKEKLIATKSVINGLTNSCGCGLTIKSRIYRKPEYKPIKHWINIINSNQYTVKIIVKQKLPEKLSKSSRTKLKFKCGCGKEFIESFSKIFSKHKKTCGKCNYITKEEALRINYGKLTLINKEIPNEFHKRTDKKLWFKCECGNEKQIQYSSIVNKKQSTCGECNLKPKEWWLNQQFGKLKIIELNHSIKLWSEEVLKCICKCGQICYKPAFELVRKNPSCGNCKIVARKWNKQSNFDNNYTIEGIKEYLKGSFIEPLETPKNKSTKFKCICKLCNEEFTPTLGEIIRGKTYSCGCLSGSYSKPSLEIAEFITELGFNNIQYGKNELLINEYKYDIYEPTNKLIIEYNGLRYHSNEISQYNNDIKKYKLATTNNYQYLSIFEDEWTNKKEIFKNILKTKLNQFKYNIKYITKIDQVNKNIANQFHEQYNYLGKTSSPINIGVYDNNNLIAVCSGILLNHVFKISRLSHKFEYNIIEITKKIIQYYTNNHKPTKITIITDNRIYGCDIYNQMGFILIKNIPPKQFWTKNSKRVNKPLAGYFKICDLGWKEWEKTCF